MLNDTNFKFICVLYTCSIPTEPDLSSLLKITIIWFLIEMSTVFLLLFLTIRTMLNNST